MPTPAWTRFALVLFVGLSFLANVVVGAIVHGAGRYAGIGALASLVVLVLLVIRGCVRSG